MEDKNNALEVSNNFTIVKGRPHIHINASFKTEFVSQGEIILALTCAYIRGVGFQGWSLFWGGLNRLFPTPIGNGVLSLTKVLS
jgi:hypothetical protein